MNTIKKAVALDVVFGARESYYRFARDVEENPMLSVTFLHRSVGKDGAWARVLVRGREAEVDQVVARWQDATVGFVRLPQAAA